MSTLILPSDSNYEFPQWTLNDAGNHQFHIRNGNGSYLSIDHNAKNGTPLIGSNSRQAWDIRKDEHDHSRLRFVLLVNSQCQQVYETDNDQCGILI